jgi:hypothetical protein
MITEKQQIYFKLNKVLDYLIILSEELADRELWNNIKEFMRNNKSLGLD